MSTPVVINGVTYQQPNQGTPSPWGAAQAAIIVALASACLQKTGGGFTLSAEVDFGSGYGLKSTYFKSRTANPGSAGPLRLANNEGIAWRNAANGADKVLKLNASDQLEMDGEQVPTQAQLGTKITDPMAADGDIIIRSGGVPARLAKGTDGKYLKLVSGLPSWQSVPADYPFATASQTFQTVSSNTWVDITGLSVSLTVGAGQLVLITLAVCEEYGNIYLYTHGTAGTMSCTGYLGLQRNSSDICSQQYQLWFPGDTSEVHGLRVTPPSFIDIPAVGGTYTYKIVGKVWHASGDRMDVEGIRMLAAVIG